MFPFLVCCCSEANLEQDISKRVMLLQALYGIVDPSGQQSALTQLFGLLGVWKIDLVALMQSVRKECCNCCSSSVGLQVLGRASSLVPEILSVVKKEGLTQTPTPVADGEPESSPTASILKLPVPYLISVPFLSPLRRCAAMPCGAGHVFPLSVECSGLDPILEIRLRWKCNISSGGQ